ncbi:MAG: ferrous iron transport protein A [Campylobacteraceae bacterium]
MKTLNDLSLNKKGVILSIDADDELLLRLFSFGIHKGTEFLVKNFSIAKSTVEIEAGKTLVALRYEEANKIQVEELF